MRAADFAARKHTNQKKKGEEAEPYLNHLNRSRHFGCRGHRRDNTIGFKESKNWFGVTVEKYRLLRCYDRTVEKQPQEANIGSRKAAFLAPAFPLERLPWVFDSSKTARGLRSSTPAGQGSIAFSIAILRSGPVRLNPSRRVTATAISSSDKWPFSRSAIFAAARISSGHSMSAR